MHKSRPFLIVITAAVGLALGPGAALAQQLPPAAAPTENVSVNALPLVRPEGQALGDYLSGLAAGLMPGSHVPGMTIAIVKNGDVLVEKTFGPGGHAIADPTAAQFRVGSLSGLVTAVAVMQLVERADILLNEDVGAALGEKDFHATIADLLMNRDDADPVLLGRVVEKISGEPLDAYVRDHVLGPLGMTQSVFDKAGLATTSADMSHFMLVLLNHGEYGNVRVLLPETVELMERTQFTYHLALAGWTYGFAELHRNGWRGLQRDGEAKGFQARLVLVPDAKTGYFIAIHANADAKFWRTLDDALFNRLFPPQAETAPVAVGVPPNAADARAASGTYKIRNHSGYDMLRVGSGVVEVSVRDDGALVLSGAEDAVLLPHAGGYWYSEGFDAAAKGGLFILGARVYERAMFWQLIPLWALVLAALAALALLGWGARRIMKS